MGRLIDADKLKIVNLGIGDYNIWGVEDCDINYAPTVEAIPKDQYEARLKADMVAMLSEIQLEIEGLNTPPAYQDEDYFLIGTNKCSELIQQKINSLKSESEEK